MLTLLALRSAADGRCRAKSRLIEEHAPALLELPGCGTLTAARLVSEVAGIARFRSDAQLAMIAGVAPLDASSGRQQRHRLNCNGNRQLNRALHQIAITQVRLHEPARVFVERRKAQGNSYREALRCLKRHLARVVFKLLKAMASNNNDRPPQRQPRRSTSHRSIDVAGELGNRKATA